MKRLLWGLCVCIGAAAFESKGQLFSQDFGSLANGTPITTANSSFPYVRVGTGAGSSLNALNPGSFSGASAVLRSTSGSLTGLGVTNGFYSAFDVGTFSFSLRPNAPITGDSFFFFLGTGAMYTGNSTFNGAEVTAGFNFNAAGQLQTRNSANAWANVGAPLSFAGPGYNIHVVFNGSAASVAYGSESVAAGSADVWINGSLFGNDVSIRDAVSTTAFRLYTTGVTGAGSWEVDNVKLFNTAVEVPEPSSVSIAALGVLAAGLVLRWKRSR